MLLLTYFDRIVGPKPFLSHPNNLIGELDKESLSLIISLLESTHDGFFTHTFSPELRTVNYTFTVLSKWARGRTETAMISVIISEEEPDYTTYEKILSKFIKKITNFPEIFKAFYIYSGSESEKKEIQKKFTILREEILNLYKVLMIKKIETEGQLISFSSLVNKGVIELSKKTIDKIKNLKKESKNYFLIFRIQQKAMKLDIIPVDTDKIFKLSIIFGEKMTMSVLHQVAQIFTNYGEGKASLIYTEGVCQELDNCIYEVYIDTDMDTLNLIINEIYKIPGIIEILYNIIKIAY